MRVSVESNSAEVDMGLGTVYVSMGTPKNASPDVTPELKGASMMAQCGSTATGGDAGAEEKLPIPDGADLKQRRRDHREAQIAVATVKKTKAARSAPSPSGAAGGRHIGGDASGHEGGEAVSSGTARSPPAVAAESSNAIGAATPEVVKGPKADGSRRKRHYCCLSRDAPVDVVEGFGGGTSRVLGVWRFVGTALYQQCITVDALLVEWQSDELLIGEDWMVERQVKMDFGDRELKYHDEGGQNVILPFTCHGVSMLQQAGQKRMVVVRLAKTVKLATNTRSVVQMGEMVSVVVRGGRREKLPAREALGTWILTDNDMQILTPNGELERTRVAKWVAALKKDDARPLQDEDKLDIGDMEVADKDLVIALLRQYAGIVHARDDLNRIPVSHFAASMVPTVNVFMDASNHGLCVL
ncbi:hypothetical protein PR001_g18584 [Phytophthora rubi]|uniref:Uncharacterized protein n=2 Tax=Phytophthora rubi TaxID=129364 RepID=A0A6A3K4M4_9STRA|nr:hypothetical protein PR001_g18584 [Phytophthora rubi]